MISDRLLILGIEIRLGYSIPYTMLTKVQNSPFLYTGGGGGGKAMGYVDLGCSESHYK